MKSIQGTVEDKVRSFLSVAVAGRHSHFIAAFSGGPDSSVLLFLLKQFQKEFSYTLSAAYINHNIRPLHEMEAEIHLITSWADSLEIPLYIKEYPPGFIDYYAQKAGMGPEGAGRNCRYHFFRKLLAARPSSLLALGHNRDDQIETLLMRIFQGTGTEGLRGIPQMDEGLIRPLLDVTRKEILEYAALKNIPYSIDSTNLSDDYRRNKIRNSLVPVLRDIFPQPDGALLRLADDVYCLGRASMEGLEWEYSREGWRIKGELFFALPLPVRKTLVLNKMDDLNKGLLPRGTRIPGRFLNPLDHAAGKERDRVILKGYHILLEKKGAWLYLRRESAGEAGGLFHLLTRENPLETKFFSLSLSDRSEGGNTYKIPVSRYLCVRRQPKGFYRICDGNDTLIELDEEGHMLHFLYEKKKMPRNPHSEGIDCVIIKSEVHYAPGR